MKKAIRQLMLSGILLNGFFLLQGCQDGSGCESDPPYPARGMISVGLVNNSDGEVHMWATSSGSTRSSEEISPNNKLMAGEARTADLVCEWNDETSKNTITVYVGRNGVPFKTGKFQITKDQWKNSCMMYVAPYEQSGSLKTFSNCP